MNRFRLYVEDRLSSMLQERRVVVFYDPRREFAPYFDALDVVGAGRGGLCRAMMADTIAHVAKFDGSFVSLRAAVEENAALDSPDPLVVYLPGAQRETRQSLLAELELAGTCFEPRLKTLARNAMRERFTDEAIDEFLAPESLTFADVESFMAQDDSGARPSLLKGIFGDVSGTPLLSHWLAHADKDESITAKRAQPELYKLVAGRVGLELDPATPLGEARDKLARYALVNEFLSDLSTAPPASVGMLPRASTDEHIKAVRDLCTRLRRDEAAVYGGLAKRIESDLGLAGAGIDPSCLGSIDTFPFEEAVLLGYCWDLVSRKDFGAAARIVAERTRSFWVDSSFDRQAHWEACRLMAELGRLVETVRPQVGKANGDGAKWVAAYSAADGWHRVDQVHRQLESWLSKVDLEEAGERAAGLVRRSYDDLLLEMAEGFAAALRGQHWGVKGVLHQTRIFPDVVKSAGGRVAYFLVDAMRFEMGAELARQLATAKDLIVRPAMAALPTITPVGMAALMPGASAAFSIIEDKGALAARIEDTSLPNLNARLRLLKAKVPDVVDLALGAVLQKNEKKLAEAIGQASLVVVRSQEIDFSGEAAGVDPGLARQFMDTVLVNLARAVRKLAKAGIEYFVVTSDHGHLFSMRREEDMRADSPGGKELDLHRRCWIGYGGTTPPRAVRVAAADLGYSSDLDVIFPWGLSVFKAGGDLAFHHGGISLQELVIPVLSFRMPVEAPAVAGKGVVDLSGVPDKLTNRTVSVRLAPGMLVTSPLPVRALLVAHGEQVGKAGLALDAELDRESGVVELKPKTAATVVLLLTKDDCDSVRVVVLDPKTDAVLAQSNELPVKLGV